MESALSLCAGRTRFHSRVVGHANSVQTPGFHQEAAKARRGWTKPAVLPAEMRCVRPGIGQTGRGQNHQEAARKIEMEEAGGIGNSQRKQEMLAVQCTHLTSTLLTSSRKARTPVRSRQARPENLAGLLFLAWHQPLTGSGHG